MTKVEVTDRGRSGMLTRIDRLWMLPPFKKALEKRQREKTLMSQLDECVQSLFLNATSRGLNLETLHNTGEQLILSARINSSHRLILAPVTKTEVGLLYFDNHDEAYQWVDRNRSNLPTMLSKVGEVARGIPLSTVLAPMPAVLANEETPLAIASAKQFREMLADGVARYLTFLDDEQRRLVDLRSTGLLLVKGGAGTGKTAVAIHRVLKIAKQPTLLGPSRVLYLCFNNLLARVVHQLFMVLCTGSLLTQVKRGSVKLELIIALLALAASAGCVERTGDRLLRRQFPPASHRCRPGGLP